MSAHVESAAMLVEAFGPLARRVMRLAKEIPEVLNVLFTARRGAFHAYVIYLTRTEMRKDANWREIASKIMLASPGELLAEAMFKDTAGLFRALDRFESKGLPPYSAYLALARITRTGHVLAPIVEQLSRFDESAIGSLGELDKHTREPLMMAAGLTLSRVSPRQIKELASAIALLRAHRLVDASLSAGFAAAESHVELFRLVLNSLGPLKLPGLGIDIPNSKLKPIASFHEYRSFMSRYYTGLSLDHLEGAGTIQGSTAWLIAHDDDVPEPVLVGLDIMARTPGGVVAAIERMHLPGLQDPDMTTRAAIEFQISALPGLTLVGSRLGQCLGRFESLELFAVDEDASGSPAVPEGPDAPAEVAELDLAA